jgi:insertion element IS1 protein InsB
MAYAEYLKTQVSSGIDVEICMEADEFWSYVSDKSNQRWTWYAIERQSGTILAHQNGRRTDEVCEQLLAKLDIFPIRAYYTDNWQSYAKCIPPQLHCIGKKDTWKIERTNLNFRTHVKRLHRKTICFSKNEDIHDKVIGLYIERHYYKNRDYAQAA